MEKSPIELLNELIASSESCDHLLRQVRLENTFGKFQPLSEALQRIALQAAALQIAEKLKSIAADMQTVKPENLLNIKYLLEATALFLLLDFLWKKFPIQEQSDWGIKELARESFSSILTSAKRKEVK